MLIYIKHHDDEKISVEEEIMNTLVALVQKGKRIRYLDLY